MEGTAEASPSAVQPATNKRSSRSLSKYSSPQANISDPPTHRVVGDEESDEEYGDIDKGFSLSTVNYPTLQQPPQPYNREPTTLDAAKSSNVVNRVYAPVRLGSQLSSRSLHEPEGVLPAPGELSGRSPTASFYASAAAAASETHLVDRDLSKTTSWRSIGSTVEMDELLSRGYTPDQAAEICRRRAKKVDNGIAASSNSKEIRKTFSAPVMAGKKPSSEYERILQLQLQAVARPAEYLRPELSRSRSPKLSPTQSRSPLPLGALDGQESYFYGNVPPVSANFPGSGSEHDDKGLGLRVPDDSMSASRNSFAQKRSTSAPQNGLPRMYSPQQSFHVTPPAASLRPHASLAAGAERDSRDTARLVSEQIAVFGVSMYNTLTESDDGHLQQLVACGMSMDDAILSIFESKGYIMASSQPPASQAAQSHSQIDFLDEHGIPVVVEVSDEDSEERNLVEGSTARDPHQLQQLALSHPLLEQEHDPHGYHLRSHVAHSRPLSSRTHPILHHPSHHPNQQQQQQQQLHPHHHHQTRPAHHALHHPGSHGLHQARHPATSPQVPYYVKYHQLHVQAQALGMTQAPSEVLVDMISTDSSEFDADPVTAPPVPSLDSHTTSSDVHDGSRLPGMLRSLSFGRKSTTPSPKHATSAQGDGGFFPPTESAAASAEFSTPPPKDQLLPGLKVSHSFKAMIGLASKVKLDKTKEEKALQRKLKYKDSDVITLINMGFTKEQSIQALVENHNHVQRAAASLLASNR